MVVIYDLEQFSNYHCCYAIDRDTEKEYFFEISDFQDDSEEYYDFINSCKGMIGFNTLAYDYPLIHYFISTLFHEYGTASEKARKLYKKSEEVINSKWGFPDWKTRIAQCDLYKIHHFDNKAKMTSLKDLQIAMKWKNVKDLPFEHTHRVSYDDRDEIEKYCRNDVLSTFQFYKESDAEIQLRNRLKRTYRIPCLNWNDPKIGEQLLLKKISEKKGVHPSVLSKKRTERKSINLGDCILDYNIRNKEVQDFVDLIKDREITETKGSINHRIVYDGMPYDFGTGGIHGCRRSKVYRPTEDTVIKSSDVKSYYPNLSIQHKFYPKHLGIEYCEVYDEIYQLKVNAEKKGDKDQRKFAKLALNASFGKSNDKYSFLYDPKYTMVTTINGQIMLTDVSITLQKAGFKCIMINTDGFEFIVPKDRVQEYEDICQEWMDETNLILEHDEYEVLAIRDVNNYVGKLGNSEIKHKGAFEINKPWYKDHSFLVIPKALEEYFVRGTDIFTFITNHDDIFDFCGRVRSNSGYKIQYHYLDGSEEKVKQLQKRNRVYISNSGGYLYKVKGDRSNAVYRGNKVQLFNKYEEKEDYDIDYQWYIKETQKIIDIIEPKQMEMFV